MYDFFYLPIDFKNKCNVGYAFLNVIQPTFIMPLVEKLHNQRWERFNSEKVRGAAVLLVLGDEKQYRSGRSGGRGRAGGRRVVGHAGASCERLGVLALQAAD